MKTHCITITEPWHGDVLNRHDGVETEAGLEVVVRGTCPSGCRVEVNGKPAQVAGESFSCPVVLGGREATITALGKVDGRTLRDEIKVLIDLRSRPRYRFSVDDNVEFLADMAANPAAFDSIFDHPYMGFWRSMNERYGAKIHINIYYQSIYRPFTLRQMPDKWKSEWVSCADWLRLTFHAFQDTPGRPYKDATGDKIGTDFDLVTEQICRFAGRELLSNFTTVHWAEAPKEACLALKARGIRGLIGLFERHPNGECTTGYYLGERLKDHADCRDFWHDFETGLTFVTCDAVVNSLALDGVVPRIEQRASAPQTGECLELLIHEQYFRRELTWWQEDVEQKVIRALEWVSQRGYEPVHWDEGFLGNKR